jgi:hypothetical protein
MARCTWYNLFDKVCQWLVAGRSFLWVLWFPPPQYNWNIVESGVKHHYRYFVYFPFDVYNQYVSYHVSAEKIQIIANR